MPWAAPRHCAAGHKPFTGSRCPACAGAAKAAADARRPSAHDRGYTSKWAESRTAFLKRHPRCGCGAIATVVDHTIPHKGDMKLFWDRTNWNSMCASCHGRKTVLEDGGFGKAVKDRGGNGICADPLRTDGPTLRATSRKMGFQP